MLHQLVEAAGDGAADRDRFVVGVGRGRRFGLKGEVGEGHHVAGDGRGVGSFRLERSVGRFGDRPGCLGVDLVDARPVEDTRGEQLALHPADRVPLGLVGQLLGEPVLALRVGARMAVRTGHVGVDEGGAHPGPHVGDDLGAPLADLHVVGAIQPVDLEPGEAPDQLGDRRRRLVAGGYRDGVAVVGDQVQHRQVQRAGGVEALPELALRGGSLAQRHVGHLVAVGPRARHAAPGDVAGGLGAAHGRKALTTGCTGLGHDVECRVPPVGRHLATARGGIVGRPHRLQHDLVGRHAESEHERLIAVVGEEPVEAGSERSSQAQQDRLVAGAGDLEEHVALLLEGDLTVVERTGEAHPPEVLEQLGDGNTAVGLGHAPTSAAQSRSWRISRTRAMKADA